MQPHAQMDFGQTHYELRNPRDWPAGQLSPANDFVFTCLIAVVIVAAALWFSGVSAKGKR